MTAQMQGQTAQGQVKRPRSCAVCLLPVPFRRAIDNATDLTATVLRRWLLSEGVEGITVRNIEHHRVYLHHLENGTDR